MTLVDTQALQRQIMANKKRQGWNTTDVQFELLELYGEVNELFRAWLHGDQANFREELADVAIFLAGIAEMGHVDLGEATLAKVAINEKRVYRNGVKVAPDEAMPTEP
ncbi:MazG nucleotide pyrophosphohydrolase domain-containing protein [Lacticaseibacillus absianus]|uniref:MazG nucleotide pyrophosphohydrolase domain-containing protein n=1 Tax=Lacticaseibacillus absianus TaxID=2729623 RepID=UPI0015CD05FA|nr:MazG nucleotide pyrophosphohydrolase domain-containing protein [Lacticaseibacillus absianus]